MNSRQETTLHMSFVLRDFIDVSLPGTIALMPGFSVLFDEFKENIVFLGDQLELQNTNRTGFAGTKLSYRQNMIEKANTIGLKIIGYASNLDNEILLNEVDYTLSDLRRMRDTDCKAACTIIHDKGVEHLGALGPYLVTDADLMALNVIIMSFNVYIPIPFTQRNVKKEATSKIAATFSRNSYLLEKMDRLTPVIKEVNPDFYMGYTYARKVNRPSSHPRAARFKVTDVDGNAIEKVLIVCKALRYKGKTGHGGGVYLKNIADNVYSFKLSKSGFVSQTIEVAITRGERSDVFVTMFLNE